MLLELVAKEKTRINEKKTNDEIAARAVEFDNEGINNCPLSLDINVLAYKNSNLSKNYMIIHYRTQYH